MKFKDEKYWAPGFEKWNNYDVPDQCVPVIDEAFERMLAIDPKVKIVQIKTKFNEVRFYTYPENPGTAGQIREIGYKAERDATEILNAR